MDIIKKYFLPTLTFLYIECTINLVLSYSLSPTFFEDSIQESVFRFGDSFFLVMLITISASFIEEYAFRGILFKNMAKYCNIFFANIVVSCLFAAMHYGHTTPEIYSFLRVGSAFFMSLYYTFIFIENNQAVYASFLAHALYNIFAMGLKLFFTKMDTLFDDKIEMMICCIFGLIVLFVIYKGYKPLYRICKGNWNKKITED